MNKNYNPCDCLLEGINCDEKVIEWLDEFYKKIDCVNYKPSNFELNKVLFELRCASYIGAGDEEYVENIGTESKTLEQLEEEAGNGAADFTSTDIVRRLLGHVIFDLENYDGDGPILNPGIVGSYITIYRQLVEQEQDIAD